MADKFTRIQLAPTRRQFLKTTAAVGGAAVLSSTGRFGEALAQDANSTLVIAAPATPQGLNLLRCSLSAAHTEEQVATIVATFELLARSNSVLSQPAA